MDQAAGHVENNIANLLGPPRATKHTMAQGGLRRFDLHLER